MCTTERTEQNRCPTSGRKALLALVRLLARQAARELYRQNAGSGQ